MIDFWIMFGFGFFWVFMISINTRLVAHRSDFWVPSGWGFVVGLFWISIVRRVVLIDSWYTLMAYALGGALATGLVTRFMPRKEGSNRVYEEVRRGDVRPDREDEG